MDRLLFSSLLLSSVFVSAQIMVDESFEGNTLPAGFTSFENSNHSTVRLPLFGDKAGSACVGSKTANLNLYGTASRSNWYFVYSSTSSNGTNLSYSFDYLAKAFLGNYAVEGNLKVEYSIDGGVNWIDTGSVYTLSTPIGGSVPCTSVSGVIPGANIPVGADFKLRIHMTNEPDADYHMGIDNFKISQIVTSPPVCNTVSFPIHGHIVDSVTPTIDYTSVMGAQSYKISVGTTMGGHDILNQVDNGLLLSYTIPQTANLLYNTDYYVTVVPANTLGTAAGCQSILFKTGMPKCPEITVPSSADATNITATPMFEWSPVSGATGYTISIGTALGVYDVIDNHDVGNVTSYRLTNPLNYSSVYYYTIKAYSGTYISQNCDGRKLTTIPTPPDNDACSTAFLVDAFPYTYDQTNGEATTNNDGFITICSSNMNDGVWYKLIGDGTTHTVNVTNVDSNYDPKMQIYQGDDCNALACVTNVDGGMAGANETVSFPTTAGTTYYIHIGHWSGWADGREGNFTIEVTKENLSTSEFAKNRANVIVTPNPFVDIVQFHDVDIQSVSVVDVSGRGVKKVEVESKFLNLGDLKSGMYILLLYHKDGRQSTLKVIKK